MEKIINTILKQNTTLFGINHKVEKINVGFTNTIYNIDDFFIVKICTNSNNENAFQKEIEFYKTNKINNLIPKMYYSSTDKKDIPYFYEIIEKIDGVSLYNVWHTFNEEQRETSYKIRRVLQKENNIEDVAEKLINLLSKTKNNKEFLQVVLKSNLEN